VLRTLFNSDFFKEAMYQKVKSPVEVVIGTLKLTGDLAGPDPRWGGMYSASGTMGQDLLNPESVEGWHTGKEWTNSGAFINRVNFVADRVRKTDLPGVQTMITRIASNGGSAAAEVLVDRCLDEMGPLEVKEETYTELVAHVEAGGPVAVPTEKTDPEYARRVGDLLALIAGTREYQFG